MQLCEVFGGWALRNCHLMRNRFTLADLLFFFGWWDGEFVEGLFDRAHSVGEGCKRGGAR